MTTRRLGLAALAAFVALGFAGCQKAAPDQPAFKGIDLTGAEYARQLSLTDQNGRARSLADFKGKVLVVFFGYTQCPDVCPTTMAEVAEVKRSLGADGDKVQGIFVTIDPARDTADLLKNYLASFDPSFIGLRGSEEQTQAAAKEFKVFYAKVPGKTPETYTMDHTAASFIFDTEGRVRVYARYGAGAEPLAHDIKLLLAEAKK
ncbi:MULTISPECIES: SCO family protein [Roseateles]|uniref:SCO family protein n=1 Tax=Pelomonas caseinilytica TaxID=2906763 RepID=A0ABS8XH86_9BURK|nr:MULTISPECIES: SCO family protein [unclassified Roseateles]MCE4538383.1 SCO family protein [Pelomonas sp. P7]HEV6964789.1 SCO family protein [Roseateles sp.]